MTPVYWTECRTGCQSCREESQLSAEARASPLTGILEKPNLDAGKRMNGDHDDRD
jgi:hypothetical protein